AVLSVKLPHLESWLEARRRHAQTYTRLLADTPFTLPTEPAGSRHTYHLFVVQCDDRENVRDALEAKGIATSIHYPTSLPFMKAYERFGHKPEDFPVSYALQSRILSLPMFAELTEDDIAYVCHALKEAVA